MAESISELYFHDSGSKHGCIGTGDGFKCAKGAHPTTSNNVSLGPLETRMRTSHISVHVHDDEWGFDGEVVHQLTGFRLGRV